MSEQATKINLSEIVGRAVDAITCDAVARAWAPLVSSALTRDQYLSMDDHDQVHQLVLAHLLGDVALGDVHAAIEEGVRARREERGGRAS